MSTLQPKKRLLIENESIPRLADNVKLHHDKIRQQWVLLAPERVLELAGPSKDVIEQCNGEITVSEIITLMASEYNAPTSEIQFDVKEMLQSLLDKKYLGLKV